MINLIQFIESFFNQYPPKENIHSVQKQRLGCLWYKTNFTCEFGIFSSTTLVKYYTLRENTVSLEHLLFLFPAKANN
jgi:hypothetical protein